MTKKNVILMLRERPEFAQDYNLSFKICELFSTLLRGGPQTLKGMETLG